MTSWLSLKRNPFEDQVVKATSSSIIDEYINLEISDAVRSKAFTAEEAMRSLKKRLDNENPNVQLAALTLIDTCFKNGGIHFMKQIATREFMENLHSLLIATGPATLNHDVKAKMLEVIQFWAAAAETKPELAYIQYKYHALVNEGHRFPPRQAVASSMFDTHAPPEWSDSDVCFRCRTTFTLTNRKHHCRNCGNIFCSSCSSQKLPLPHLGFTQPERVDDSCYSRLTDKSKPANFRAPSQHQHHPPHPGTIGHPYQNMQPRDTRVDDSFEADLKRALAMSLEEAKAPHGQGYVPPAQARIHAASLSKPLPQPQLEPTSEQDQEDAELKAAVELSLRDMEVEKKKHNATLGQAAASDSASQPIASNPNDISPKEKESIYLFSSLVDRLKSQPPGTILRDPRVQELYETTRELRLKLGQSFAQSESKHEMLRQMHANLDTLSRYHDQMLEEKAAKAYAIPPSAYSYSSTFNPAPYNVHQPESYYMTTPAVVTAQTSNTYQYPQAAQPAAYGSQPTAYGLGPSAPVDAARSVSIPYHSHGFNPSVPSMPLPTAHPSAPSMGTTASPAQYAMTGPQAHASAPANFVPSHPDAAVAYYLPHLAKPSSPEAVVAQHPYQPPTENHVVSPIASHPTLHQPQYSTRQQEVLSQVAQQMPTFQSLHPMSTPQPVQRLPSAPPDQQFLGAQPVQALSTPQQYAPPPIAYLQQSMTAASAGYPLSPAPVSHPLSPAPLAHPQQQQPSFPPAPVAQTLSPQTNHSQQLPAQLFHPQPASSAPITHQPQYAPPTQHPVPTTSTPAPVPVHSTHPQKITNPPAIVWPTAPTNDLLDSSVFPAAPQHKLDAHEEEEEEALIEL